MRSADYVIKRGFFALVTVFVAITINFFLFRVLPGNAVSNLSRVPKASPQLVARADRRVRPGQAEVAAVHHLPP